MHGSQRVASNFVLVLIIAFEDYYGFPLSLLSIVNEDGKWNATVFGLATHITVERRRNRSRCAAMIAFANCFLN